MHYVLTNKDFSASHWHDFFDDILIGDKDLEQKSGNAHTVWLCTAIKEWPDLLKKLSAQNIHVAVLAMSPTPDEAKIALGLGAKGYLHAAAPKELLTNARTTIAAGGYWIPNELLLGMLGQFNSVLNKTETRHLADPRLSALTQRELEVCHEVAKGNSNKVIARHLNITERTVKEHLSRSFAKLGVKDRMQVMLLINGKLTTTTDKVQGGRP